MSIVETLEQCNSYTFYTIDVDNYSRTTLTAFPASEVWNTDRFHTYTRINSLSNTFICASAVYPFYALSALSTFFIAIDIFSLFPDSSSLQLIYTRLVHLERSGFYDPPIRKIRGLKIIYEAIRMRLWFISSCWYFYQKRRVNPSRRYNWELL